MIKNILKKMLTYSLLFWRHLTSPLFSYQEISVLCYHALDDSGLSYTISKEGFIRHITYLRRYGYYFSKPREILRYIEGDDTLPKKTVLLTFDDGYASTYDAFLHLREYKIPMTVFLVGEFYESTKERENELPGLDETKRLEMSQSGLVTFGYHGNRHKMLDTLSGQSLKQEVKSDCDLFAYAGGHTSTEAIDAVKDSGYSAAFSISPGLIHRGDNAFRIKRNVITRDMGMLDFAVLVTMANDWYQTFRRRI